MKSLLLTAAVAATTLPGTASARHVQSKLENANHIFNAIHDSMRQFGSSISYYGNGMSVFLATVPAETEFYHGTSTPYRQNGTEWLAFEPEHALGFARSGRGGPGGGRRGPPGGQHPPGQPDHDDDRKQDLRRREKSQRPLNAAADDEPGMVDAAEEESHGYFHTYRTKHELRLLYVDGQSAAKSDKGTLDTQDLVLLHHTPPNAAAAHDDSTGEIKDNKPPTGGHGPMGESARAEGLCRVAREEYDGRIDGFLRMEGGFEIILCDFAKDLDVVSIAQAASGAPGGPGSNGGDSLNYYRAVAARFDGIGGDRVSVDYEHFVSMFIQTEALYWDDHGRPRAKNETAVIDPVRKAIKKLALSSAKPEKAVDWQAVVDMVVARYAYRLEMLSDPSQFDDLESFQAEALRGMRPFIDYGHRNKTAEVARCASQFIPSTYANTPAAAAVTEVTHVICRTFSRGMEVDTLAHGLSTMRALKSWLSWTTWKRCRGCAADEVCYLPIWPGGSIEDFEEPKCRSNPRDAGRGYWGGFGGPPRGGNGKDESDDA